MNQQFQSQRRSIRLERHDYSSAGAYFATVCTETRGLDWFGTVSSDGVQLSAAGEMVRYELERLPQRFTNLEIDEFIVMPDHIHVIFILYAAPHLETIQPAPDDDVDTSIRRGELNVRPAPHAERHIEPIQPATRTERQIKPNQLEIFHSDQPSPSSEFALGVRTVKGEHAVRPYALGKAQARGEYVHPNGTQADSIGRIVQLLKTFTTQEYIKGVRGQGWQPFEKRFWERNYWERVIRDDAELEVKRAYIAGKPTRWLEGRGV